jgi:hypothetical protein
LAQPLFVSPAEEPGQPGQPQNTGLPVWAYVVLAAVIALAGALSGYLFRGRRARREEEAA